MNRILPLAVTALAAMLAASDLSHCADLDGETNDPQLNAAIEKYIQCHKQQDYKCVWGLWSRRLKEGNDNDQVGFEKDFMNEGFHPSDFVVQKGEESRGTAVFIVTVTYVEDATKKKYGSAVEEWRFVKENGSWLFDDYKTLSESP